MQSACAGSCSFKTLSMISNTDLNCGYFLSGLILGVVLSHKVPEGRPLLFFFGLSIGLLASALMLYVGLQQLGVNLSW